MDASASAERTRPAHLFVAVPAILLVLVTGLYGTWFWLTRDRGPPPEAFPAAAAVIRADYQPTDLILLVPFYATRAKEQLGDLVPIAVRDPLLEDFDVHPRVWVLGLFGEAEKLRPRMLARNFELLRSAAPPEAAGITVDLYETGATMRTTYSFLENLRRAKVYHDKDGAKVGCAEWTEKNGQGGPLGRWACPYDKEWFYVAPEWHRMGDIPRLCLWAHPPNQGRLVISFPDVPLAGLLYGRAGHTLNSSIYARASVNLDVAVGDLPPQRFTFQLRDHFRPFMLDTPATGTATVSFAVSSPDAGANHFCFTAELRASQ